MLLTESQMLLSSNSGPSELNDTALASESNAITPSGYWMTTLEEKSCFIYFLHRRIHSIVTVRLSFHVHVG